VTLTAAPAVGSAFTGWSGGGCSGTGSCIVNLTTDTTVTATFVITRTLTVNKAGNGTGSVSSSPAGITCGATCSAGFNDGASVTLTATASNGSAFTGWSGGGCSGTGSCIVSLSANTTVTATFTLLRSLTVNKVGTGTGTVTGNQGSGINCGATCNASIVDGFQVTLSASPSAGSIFTGWSGGGCSGTGTCVLPMTSDATVTATFTSNAAIGLTVVKTGGGSGTVTSSPAGINCGATCTANYTSGTVITLSAAWDADTVFAGWSGASCGRTSVCTLTLTSPTTITARFRPFAPRLSVTLAGLGAGSVQSTPAAIDCGDVCANTFAYNTSVTLTATPDVGADFTGWLGGGCSGTGDCVVNPTDDTSVTATFADTTAPHLALTGPTAFFLGARSVDITWTTDDIGGSGVDHVQAQWERRAVGGGTFTAWKGETGWDSVHGDSVKLGGLASAFEYCFRARAVDGAGNVGGYASPKCTRIPVDDSGLSASSGWSHPTNQAGYFDGTFRGTATQGLTLKTPQSVTVKRIGVLVTTCPTCGKIDVLLGQAKVATLSLHSTSATAHRWLLLSAFASSKTGVITLKVASSGKSVKIDALGYSLV
jgi:hypothetical protein